MESESLLSYSADKCSICVQIRGCASEVRSGVSNERYMTSSGYVKPAAAVKRCTSVVGQICELQSSGTSADANFSVSTAASCSLTCFKTDGRVNSFERIARYVFKNEHFETSEPLASVG